MRDTRVARQRADRDLALQCRDAIDAARPHEPPVLIDDHAARIVAAVFEPLQPVHQVGHDIAPRHRADNSTHIALRETIRSGSTNAMVESAQWNLISKISIL
nr:glutamine-fructose-6-phosphate transaminase [Burkholderia pseudomallei]